MTQNRVPILVVDDEANIRELLQRQLVRAGYGCVTARTAAHAAEILRQEHFDVVILDIMMPGKSGMEFLPELISGYPDVAVVMMTAVMDIATAVKAMRDGAYDYITKPVNLDELTTRIGRALERRTLLLQNRAYQENLERMVAAGNDLIEQRNREVKALKGIMETQLNRQIGAQDPQELLEKALTDINASIRNLVGFATAVEEGGRAQSGEPGHVSPARGLGQGR